MTPEIQGALVALIVTIIGSIGGLVVYLAKEAPNWVHRAMEVQLVRMEAALAENTAITTETRTLSNGRLTSLQDALDALRVALDDEREQRERLERIIAAVNEHPASRACLDEVVQRLRKESDTE
jgi:uncharacterized membrane protein